MTDMELISSFILRMQCIQMEQIMIPHSLKVLLLHKSQWIYFFRHSNEIIIWIYMYRCRMTNSKSSLKSWKKNILIKIWNTRWHFIHWTNKAFNPCQTKKRRPFSLMSFSLSSVERRQRIVYKEKPKEEITNTQILRKKISSFCQLIEITNKCVH